MTDYRNIETWKQMEADGVGVWDGICDIADIPSYPDDYPYDQLTVDAVLAMLEEGCTWEQIDAEDSDISNALEQYMLDNGLEPI